MPAPDHAADEFFLDARAVRRSFDACATTFDASAAVHAEIRKRLLERLDVVRLEPGVVIDLGAGTGHASRALQDRYSGTRIVAMDLSPRMLVQARRQQRLFRRFDRVAAAAERLPLRDGSVDLVFSNLMLQWCSNPDSVFGEIRRVLRPNGLVTFTTLGPDTLKELRQVWSRFDRHVHVHRFIDMHDLGDALLRAGFAEPVMDTERLTITYSNGRALLDELVGSGSANIARGRRHGLTGRTTGAGFLDACEALRTNGSLPISLEVVYGHAWIGEKGRASMKRGGEALFPLEKLRRRP